MSDNDDSISNIDILRKQKHIIVKQEFFEKKYGFKMKIVFSYLLLLFSTIIGKSAQSCIELSASLAVLGVTWSSLLQLTTDMAELRAASLPFGFSCVYRFGWERDETTITYSKVLDSSTNIYMSGINLTTGVFTASVSGTYSVSFSFFTSDKAEDGPNDVFLFRNGTKITESLAPSETAISDQQKVAGKVFQTSGRTLYFQLEVSETLHLGCVLCHKIWRVNFCVALVKQSSK